MDFTNSTFAHGLQIGQTLAPHASNGQAIPGNCNDKTSSEKMKMKPGKAMAMAVILFFAMATHVIAQTAVTETGGITKYVPVFGTVPNVINSQIYDDGATGIGIGTNSPSSYLHIIAPAATECLQIQCYYNYELDPPTDYFKIINGTSLLGTFQPFLWGNIQSTDSRVPLNFMSTVNPTYDDNTSTTPLMTWNARRWDGTSYTAISYRPLFAWYNDATTEMQMDVSGDLGIGTTSPGARLDVVGTGNTSATYAFKAENTSGNIFNVEDDGKVGIGVSPPGAFIDVKTNGYSGSAFAIANSLSNSIFTVNNSGSVAINNGSPTAFLDVITNSSSGNAVSIYNSSSNPVLVAQNGGAFGFNVGSPGALLDMYNPNSGNSAINVKNSGATNIFHLTDAGYLGMGNITTPEAMIDIYNSGTGSAYTGLNGIDADVIVTSGSSTASGYSADAVNNGTGDSYGLSTSAITSTGNAWGVNSGAEANSDNSVTYGVFSSAAVANYTGGSSYTNAKVYGIYASASVGDNTADVGNCYSAYLVGDIAKSSVTWTISDQKFKKNIQPVQGALENIMKLKPKTYNLNTQDYPYMSFSTKQQNGLIAQDVAEVFPNLTKDADQPEIKDKKGNVTSPALSFKMVNYEGLIPVTIAAIQQQQDTIVKQQTVIQQQQGQIAAQQTQLVAQQAQLTAQQAQNAQLQNSMSDLQNQFSSVLAEIEQLKTIQAECCGSVGSSSTTGSNNVGNGSNNDQPNLAQNVPNPFTQNTIISYYLPASMPNAVITIRSMTGTTLQSYNITSAGHGQITVSQGTLAPATYEYDMIVNGKLIDSKKMVIVGE